MGTGIHTDFVDGVNRGSNAEIVFWARCTARGFTPSFWIGYRILADATLLRRRRTINTCSTKKILSWFWFNNL